MPEQRAAIIDRLLDRWEEAHEQGLNISPEDLCQDCPELLSEIQHKISVLQTMNRCMKQPKQGLQLIDGEKDLMHDSFRVDSKFGDFETLGSGGLGVVYRAVDYELNRDVAIKFLRDSHQSDYFLKQFRQEAEITGRLDHPGVVPVYGMGRSAQGELFYSMRLIRGDTLDQKIKEFHQREIARGDSERWMALRDLLQRFTSVCKTIAYAHTRGILHRDIKPHNIMLGKYGETLVVDWGLAIPFQRPDMFRVLDEKTLLPRTSDGKVAPDGHGTPAYMSPEQAAGNQQLDATSDIFALGATLYKLLTGQIPFQGKNSVEVKQAIMEGEFKAPHVVDHRVSKTMSAICSKALAHRPADRYQTAMELADDIERYMAGEPVSAYREPIGRRIARWAQRNQTLAQWSTLALIAALVGAVTLAIVQFRSAQEQELIKSELNQSLTRSQQARKNGAKLTTLLIARAIEFDLQNRFTMLEHVAANLGHAPPNGSENPNPGESNAPFARDQWLEILDQARYESDCVAPVVAWFACDQTGSLVAVSADTDAEQVIELGLDTLLNPVRQANGQSSLDQQRIQPFVVDADLNQSYVLMVSPIHSETERGSGATAIGMMFRTSVFSKLRDDELAMTSIRQIHLLWAPRGDTGDWFFREPMKLDGLPDPTLTSRESTEDLFSWIDTSVRSDSMPTIREQRTGQFRTAVPLSVKNGQLMSVESDWFLIVDFE